MITTLRRQVVKRCPYGDETDVGELVIVIPGRAPELHELATQVGKITAEPISHEDFTQAVHDLVPGAEVLSTWHTGPWDVECREGGEAVAA